MNRFRRERGGGGGVNVKKVGLEGGVSRGVLTPLPGHWWVSRTLGNVACLYVTLLPFCICSHTLLHLCAVCEGCGLICNNALRYRLYYSHGCITLLTHAFMHFFLVQILRGEVCKARCRKAILKKKCCQIFFFSKKWTIFSYQTKNKMRPPYCRDATQVR